MQRDSIDVKALAGAGLAALEQGDAARARDLLERVVTMQGADVQVWLALAGARASLGDGEGQVAALEQAAALAPNDLRVLLGKGDHFMEQGDPRGASAFYSAAMQYMPRLKTLPQTLQDGLRRAHDANRRLAQELEESVRATLAARGLGPDRVSPRFRDTVEVLFGKKRVYVQEPRFLYFPHLPHIQFYERRDFPWLDKVEAAFEDIRAELRSAIGGDFKPYVTQAAGRPHQSQAGMVDDPSWSALFLYKDGVEQPWAQRCPRTLEALSDAPLTQIPNRTPSVLFSKMAAGARIPPHTGMLNTRLICHLPLIVPAGCEFRVGNDVRPWVEGKAWVFDDTIEHEAWNPTTEDRYVLLFDIWRPELSEKERAGVALLCAAVDAYRGGASWDA